MTAERRFLVTGGTGQVGLELARAARSENLAFAFPTRDQLDLASEDSIAAYLAHGEWAGVVNCAAYTAVDQAEDNVSEAFRVNALGSALLAEAARRLDLPMIQISTDYVFDGSLDRPYREDDPVAPLGVYGASKLAGEHAVLLANPRGIVLRTAWVVSAQRANFLKTMLRVGAANPQLRVVADQVGCPTSAADIAAAIVAICYRLVSDLPAPAGVYHFVNAGEASWYELASHIFEVSGAAGGPCPQVLPITTVEYPTRARRPANSRLDIGKLTADFGIQPRHWHQAIADIVAELTVTSQTREKTQ